MPSIKKLKRLVELRLQRRLENAEEAETYQRPRWTRSRLVPSGAGCPHARAAVERRTPRVIMRCVDCRIGFPKHPLPTDQSLPSHWASHRFEQQYKLDRGWTASHFDPMLFRTVFLHGSGVMMQEPPNRKALDIGSGAGFFVKLLQGYFDYEVIGLEPSNWGCTYARDTLGLTNIIQAETPSAAGLPDNTFGFISLIHTLEHVPDPLALLKDIARVAAPGAIFYGEVPDSDHLEDWNKPEHRWFFTDEALDFHLQSAGFQTLRIFPGRSLPWPQPIPFLSWAAVKPKS